MNNNVLYLDQSQRIAEKQKSRDEDAFRLENNLISAEDLGKENSFFANFPFHEAKIKAIGNKKINY